MRTSAFVQTLRRDKTVCPRLGAADHAYGGKGEYTIESALHSFGENVLLCNTLGIRALSNFSLLNCPS
jgi:hypothetical protein